MHIANLSVADALGSLRTSEHGLTEAEAQKRLQEYGPNRIEEVRGDPQWRRFLNEFTHFFALILWLAAGLAFFAESRSPGEGMWQLGLAIVAVILINGSFSFWQEYRAEQALAALRRLLPQFVKVVRDGQLLTLPAEVLVPGDLVLLEEGDNVPADCRLIAGADVRVNMSTVTGESLPKARRPEPVAPTAALDSRNLLLAGTSLVSGQGSAVIFATGMRTEFGRIAHLTQTTEKNVSHLQQEIARLSKLVAIFATGLGLVFFVIGMLIGIPFWANLMFAIGIIVANVPEGLLPTVTLSLALATQRMARRNALVRHLPAVETMGCATVILTDKTGTLTQNRMAVREWFAGGRHHLAAEGWPAARDPHLRAVARYCQNLKFDKGQPIGDPMEVALWQFAGEIPMPWRSAGEIAFDAERRRMSVYSRDDDGSGLMLCKGAPENLLPHCTNWLDGDASAASSITRNCTQCACGDSTPARLNSRNPTASNIPCSPR